MHLEANMVGVCDVLAPHLTLPRLISPTAQHWMLQQQHQVAAVCSLKPGWAGLVREDAEVTWGGSTSSGQVEVG